MARTLIIGIGSAGCNTAETIRRESEHPQLISARYIFADVFAKGPHIPHMYLDPESIPFPASLFQGFDTVCIIAGLGGTTGSNYTADAALKARAAGVPNVLVVATTPFTFEGEKRAHRAMVARERLNELEGVATHTFANDILVEKYPEMEFFDAFNYADRNMMQIVEQHI